MARKPFKGVIQLDVRDSTPDWEPFTLARAPEGAPNILIVLYDDTGLAAWSPFGGAINMPTLQNLADRGLMYSQWHTTALCSPTRSTFLTGRNHHQIALARGLRRAMHGEGATALRDGADGPGVVEMRRIAVAAQVCDQNIAGQAGAAMPDMLGNRHEQVRM